MDQDKTLFVLGAHRAEPAHDERLHCLEWTDGPHAGRIQAIGPSGVVFGRAPPADVVLADTEVSRSHCRVLVDGADLVVTDLDSTNGVFVDGARVAGSTRMPVGAVLRIGRQAFRHEWRSAADIRQADEHARDLEKARAYVQALLPPPVLEGPIRADWVYEPCAKLGGDAFGYAQVSDRRYAAYLVDVSGHGAGAALHSVAVMNVLRQRALANTDMSEPSDVLAALNAMFQMDAHAGMYFTIWYGVYDIGLRKMKYASAGHHPGYLTTADKSAMAALRTRNSVIGAMPGTAFKADLIDVPPGARLYLFSDGAFEITTTGGGQWSLSDFLPLIGQPPQDGLTESARLFAQVKAAARPGGLDDDFSALVVSFD